MYLAFNNDSTFSFNITVCCTFMKCHILPSCVHFTKLSNWRSINFYSYSYSFLLCYKSKKKVCCYLVSEIGILGNMRAELSFDD